jgi:hypothetical protein
MRWLWCLLAVVGLAGGLAAQERQATVTLDDGRVLTGRVVALDLGSLQLQIGAQVETFSALRIQSCVFSREPAAEPAGGGSADLGAEARPGAASAEAVPRGAPAVTVPAPESRGLLRQRRLPVTLEEPIEVLRAQAFDPEAQPHDLRHRSLWRRRLEALDQAYPWLCPAAPVQWASLGSLLFVLCSLAVYASVKIAGLDQATLVGSMAMSLWYLLAGVVQFCQVPDGDLALLAMLVGNAALACFWLRQIFGMTRSATVVAFAVQIGFAVLGLGVVQVADSLLRSVHAGQV